MILRLINENQPIITNAVILSNSTQKVLLESSVFFATNDSSAYSFTTTEDIFILDIKYRKLIDGIICEIRETIDISILKDIIHIPNHFIPNQTELEVFWMSDSSFGIILKHYLKSLLVHNTGILQYNYCYKVFFGHWDDEKKEWKEYEGDEVRPEFEFIEESLFDGTHDKLHDRGLMQYHQAGKPKKLALQWHIKKSVYSAYLWFEDFKIRAAFEQFYIKYPESKMNFIFRIDTDKKVFQISFNCTEAGLPIQLNDSAYQMIIFKNKFEYYRTTNYNQPRGAWVW